jgi:tRNA U34 5-methylaminomethyl-2-thiouridine-forming methyltransferase MnmC
MSDSIVVTQDGSKTIINEGTLEHYHSVFGAVQESRHIFIDSGLKLILQSKNHINILEVGLGTGLNALLTLIEARSNVLENVTINYFGIEPYPIDESLLMQLDYCNYLKVPELMSSFIIMHKSAEKAKIQLASNFNYYKYTTPLERFNTDQNFDLVYFDAFSPANEPNLWTEAIFSKLHTMMNKGAILVTYCSKGAVRRTMQICNYSTERLPGPPGKHEILRATAK